MSEPSIVEQLKKSKEHLESIFGNNVEMVIAEKRYGFIKSIAKKAVAKPVIEKVHTSDRIDQVVTNRLLGLPIFLFLMWLMFKLTFTLSEPFMGYIESAQDWLGNLVGGVFPDGSPIQGLLVDGIIGGLGSVLVFVPIIFLMFFFMAILEDSGYMARAAFIMDKVMHKIGLHGKSFIPMVLGFGCNVPAIMATRTIEAKRDRLVTILVNPFISCGARLPIYALFIGIFFPEKSGTVLFSLYTLGIIIAILMAKVFRKYLFPGEASPFLMELPPYRVPTIKGVIIHMWERGKLYLKKAGTIIFAGCVAVWLISNFPWNPGYSKDYMALIEKTKDEEVVAQLKNEMAFEKLEKSYAGSLGRTVEPFIRPLGFDWKIGVGLIGGFVAKEIVVGTLGTLYSVGEAEEESKALRESIKEDTWPDGRKVYTPLTAFALMVFCLLYVPCVASIGVIFRETNSWKWPAFAAIYTTAVAWIMSFIVYQGGKLIGLG